MDKFNSTMQQNTLNHTKDSLAEMYGPGDISFYRENSMESDIQFKLEEALDDNKYQVERLLHSNLDKSTNNMQLPSYRHKEFRYKPPGSLRMSH